MSGRRLLAVLAIAALISATGIAAEKAWETENSRVAEQHQAAAREAAAQAHVAFDSAIAHSAGGQGLAKASGGIRRRGFRIFAQRAIRQGGLTAVAWHPLIPQRRSRTFERATGAPIVAVDAGGHLHPAGRMRYHLPVRLLEGHLHRRTALGVDALAVPELAFAARRARDQGVAVASAPVPLLGSNRWGVLVFRPVYQPGQPIGTIASRRRALVGEVSVALPSASLADQIAAALPAGETLDIQDRGRPVVGIDAPDATQASTQVGVGGRTWIVSIGGLKGPSELPPAAISIAGFSLAMLVGVLFAAAARRETALDQSRRKAQRAAAREALLVKVGDALERTVSVEGRLDEFARTIVPGLADLCSIDLELGDRRLRRVGVAATDPGQEAVLGQLPPPAEGVGRIALETATVQLVPNVDDEVLRSLGSSPDDYALRRSLGVESMIVAPLQARDRVMGILTMYTAAGSGRLRFSEDDAALAAEIADRAALALDNARLYEQQLDIAQTLQRALLPRRLPQPDRLEVAARHRAGREGTEVGGDFYDFFDGAGGWVAAVGDVCGKGAEAAALTGLVRHTLRASAELERPADALSQVDRAIYRETHGSTFCTMACASIDLAKGSENGSMQATAAIGGHPEPMIIREGGGIERVGRTGPLLGRTAYASFEQATIDLHPGDTLLMYTDGVTEARANGQLFGESRLVEIAERWGSLPLDTFLAKIESEVVRFADGHPQDDIAVLAVRILPP